MTIIHSSDLGWKAGQDISSEFAAVAKTLQPGDVFVFDHMYDISGSNIQLANNVTLAGGAPGAGIDIQDVATSSNPLLILSDGNTFVDMTVKHGSSIYNSTNKNLKTSIKTDGDDISIINSSFTGGAKTFVEAEGDNLSVVDTVFDGGYYQMRWIGEATNFTVENSLFQNSHGDGIKTARDGSGQGTQNATISNSVFLNNNRDGIDTTGGFKDSIINDSYFVNNNVSAIDFKNLLVFQSDLSPNLRNENIHISNSEFIADGNTSIVTTLLNRGGFDNANKYAPNNITFTDSIFENTSINTGWQATWLIKDGFNINSVNNTYLGAVRTQPLNNPEVMTFSGDTTGPARSAQPDSYYQNLAGPDWASLSYPTNGTPTPIDTTPDPISYTPNPPADPVVDDPAPVDPIVVDDPEPEVVVVAPTPNPTPTPDTGSASIPSKLLNVYLAYTKTDKNVVELSDGAIVDNGLTAGKALTVYATSQDGTTSIGSVRLEIPGVGTRTENAEPFALFGDNGAGNFFGNKELKDGTYTVEMTAFEGKNGTGKKLEAVSFDFTIGDYGSGVVVDTDPVTSDPDPVVVAPVVETDLAPDAGSFAAASRMFDIKLIDTASDIVIAGIYDGAKLSNADFSGNKITISAEAIDPGTAGIGSMKLELDGKYSKIESVAPYALFGDNAEGNFFGGKELDDGMHFATLTAYSGKNGKGSVLEKVTVNFEIGNYDAVEVNGLPGVVGSYSAAQDKGTAKVWGNKSSIALEDNAWKTIDISKVIEKDTVLNVKFKSDMEGEIHGIGLSNGQDNLENTFFQLDGSQILGIQDFNGSYQTGSGWNSYSIPVGEHFTGEFNQIVLITDDDAGVGASSVFDSFNFVDALA